MQQAIDRLSFPSIPRATPQFERRYHGRTAVERVNARLKALLGIAEGNLIGSRPCRAHVSAVLIAHLATETPLAKAQRKEGTVSTLRLTHIVQKLENLAAVERDGPLNGSSAPGSRRCERLDSFRGTGEPLSSGR